MQNYHRHSSYSNIYTVDSPVMNEAYAKRAVELGHKIISSVEHGWQGYYYETFELAKKYGLKFIFGTEAYWVKDRLAEYPEIDKVTGKYKENKKGEIIKSKDRSNCHMIILAKNENGRRAINAMLSTANEDGYYFRPRVDLNLILQLPADDVFITTACVAFWKYSKDEMEDIVLKLHDYFKDNFMLEIQYHATEKQRLLNMFIKELSYKHGIKMIVGLDSHYIHPEEAADRQYLLDSKDVKYEDEDGWYMDYPDDETVMQRFLDQCVFSKSEIQEAMNNTDVLLTFDDYDGVPIFNKDIKLPTLYPDKTEEEKNKIYEDLIHTKLKEYLEKYVSKERWQEYIDGVESEIKVYEKTHMVDYPLIDYEIVKLAKSRGGLITNTGRGSGVGYFTNTLCGFSKVDRFVSPIKLYPERFISESRILETHSLPDLDLNLGNPEVFEQAQKDVLGNDHAYPMIAFGTAKKKSAFKMYARSQNMDFELQNTISKQIEAYELALKEADDDEKDDINIYDFVDEQYHPYITQSQKYWGIITDKKKAPCAHLLYQGSIREEIGLIKCKSDSTGKEYMTAVIDGAIAEAYKFLKNDLLKVDVVLLIDKIYKRIGMEPHTVNELMEAVEHDDKVWNVYANGYTQGLNQVEKIGTTNKMKHYKAHNVSEMAAFVAAIRPSFKTMYKVFADREDFKYGIEAFDKLLQTPQFPYSLVLYQEQCMNTLNYAGFPMDECYGIIKAIAKKHPEKVLPLKARFIEGFKEKILEGSKFSEQEALKMSEDVWQIMSNFCGYGFNASHALCVALDSLYNAWQKANYPYEFYEVMLQHYSDKGNKAKVALLKQEMFEAFGIKEGSYAWGNDNRSFRADEKNGVIYPALNSIKSLSTECAEALYDASQYMCCSFAEVLKVLKNYKEVNTGKIEVLIKLDYFREFGGSMKLWQTYRLFERLYGKKQLKKEAVADLPQDLLAKYCDKETDKMYKFSDTTELISAIAESYPDRELPLKIRLEAQKDYLGYITYKNPKLKNCIYVMDVNTKYSPVITGYDLATGETKIFKIYLKNFREQPVAVKDVLVIQNTVSKPRMKLVGQDENGKNIFEPIPNEFWTVINDYVVK